MAKGTVKWFTAEKGCGFIAPEDGGKDLFVHHSDIQAGGGYSTLNDGQAVEFEVGQTEKGPCAKQVIGVYATKITHWYSSKVSSVTTTHTIKGSRLTL